jgi:PAS domain-containing protein
MFALFILGCRTTHLMEVWTVWHSSYLLSGIIKAITAAISVITAVLLITLIPKAIALPGPQHLQTVNRKLQWEIGERLKREQERTRLADDLERRVEERTRELEAINRSLEEQISLGVKAQAALGASEERTRLILENALDAILTIDAEQHILLFNRAAEKMFRCMAKEAIGQSLNRFIPERFRSAHGGQHYLQRIQEGTSRMGMLRFWDVCVETLATVRYASPGRTGLEFLLPEPQLEQKIEDCLRGLLQSQPRIEISNF